MPKSENPMLRGDAYNAISPTNVPGSLSPTNILYLKIDYNNSTFTWAYNFMSGTYPLGNGIGDFITAIQDNTLTDANRISPIPDDGTPVIQDACYVLFALDPGAGGTYKLATPPVAVTTSSNYPDDYFHLVTVSDPETSNCYFAHFKATSPSHTTEGIDYFNLNLESGTIDPDIKNTGHPGLILRST